MPDKDDNINQLYTKLESLIKQGRRNFYREINDIKTGDQPVKNPAETSPA